MKLIFDFDDTLFKNTPEFKEHLFSVLEKFDVPKKEALAYYQTVRAKEFSLKNFLEKLLGNTSPYEEIMKICPNLLNEELLAKAKEAGVENCYLVTNGDQEFQKAKIEATGIAPLFKEIRITPGNKKEIIEKICLENPEEEILFYEDKEKFFKDLDLKKCKNLKIKHPSREGPTFPG